MIGRLRGTVLRAHPGELLLDVGGIGYRVQIPLSTFYQLGGVGHEAAVFVHTHVREDAILLFGFSTEEEQMVFEDLIAVSGIGPKIALAVLSGIGTDQFGEALRTSDRAKLERIPGIGRKTAERVLLELRDRLGARNRRSGRRAASVQASGPAADDGMVGDAVSALINLGYSEDRAREAVDATVRSLPEADRSIEHLLRASLRALVR